MNPLEDLQAIRRRLAEEAGGDVGRYAAMLKEASARHPGRHVDRPLRPRRTLQVDAGADAAEAERGPRPAEVAVAA